MGWDIHLESNKEITESEIQEIIDNLPESMYFFGFKPSKQLWGWNCINDVSFPHGQSIIISGAYGVSENMMSNYIKKKLEENGHKISVSVSY